MARVEVKQEGGHLQVEDRYTSYLNDGQGRTWTGIFSRKSGSPADYPTPTGWTSPQTPQYLRGLFLPPEQYRTIVRPEGKPMSIAIDYDRWISDLNAGQASYEQTKRDVINKQADGYDAIRLMEDPPKALLDIIGPGPFPPLEVVERMADGDEWALGISAVIPEWFTPEMESVIKHTARQTGLFQTWQLRELNKRERTGRQKVVETREAEAVESGDLTERTKWPMFLKAGTKAGKTREEISIDWRAHKDAIQAGV